MAAKYQPGFFALHGEKLGLGAIIAASGFFLYMGMGQESYLDKYKPNSLQQSSNQVRTSIDDDHWEALKESDERVVTANYGERVDKSRQPIPVGPYATSSPWEYRGKNSGARREDPSLIPPSKPAVVGVLASLAVDYQEERVYPLSELEDADPIEVKKPRRKRSSRRNNNNGGFGGYGGGYGSGGDGLSGGGGSGGSEGAGGMGPGGAGPGGGSGLGGMGPGGGAPGGSGSDGDDDGRSVDKENNLGFDGTKFTADEQEQVGPEAGHFLAITALVEHRKLVEAYELAFQNAQGYNPVRDQPRYWEFEVQRADVTDKAVDALADDDWMTVSTFKEFKKNEYDRWAGTSADVTPNIYSDPALTWPIPPTMFVDLTKYTLHPDLPMGDEITEIEGDRPEEGDDDEDEGDEDDQDGPNSFGGGGPSGFGGDDDFYGSGGMGGMDGGGGLSGAGGGGMSGGEMGGFGGGSGFYGGGGAVSSKSAPTYKLVRCYDFANPKNAKSPKPGRKYVYRVRVALEDPNFPMTESMQPAYRYLSPEVYARIDQKRKDSEKKDGKRDPRFWSDWSEPSEPASLPSTEMIFAGSIKPGDTRTARLNGKEIEFKTSSDQVEFVGLKWDSKLGSYLIVSKSALPGTIIAERTVAPVIDPLTLAIRKIDDEKLVSTGVSVLSSMGGKPLQIVDDEEEMTQPGFALLFDADGNVQVRSELEDMDSYRLYSFADEREAAEKAASQDDGNSGGYDGGYGSGGGYPGGGSGGGFPGGSSF